MSDKTIQVRFFTKDDSLLSCPDIAFDVPIKFKRWGLSELVNHLLSTTDKKIPYDFLHNGIYIRGSLLNYIKSNNISEEIVLNLEYVKIFEEPDHEESETHPDWISSIDLYQNNLLYSCYDGITRIKPADKPDVITTISHNTAVTCCKWLNNKLDFVTGSKDRLVKIFEYQDNKTILKATSLAYNDEYGHIDSIECIATNNTSKFISAGWDKKIICWDYQNSLFTSDELDNIGENSSRKKRRMTNITKEAMTTNVLKPVSIINNIHNDVISDIIWPYATSLYTVSWDHTMKLFDMTTSSISTTWNAKSSFHCIDYSNDTNLLLTGHSDKIIRIWDPKINSKEALKYTFKSHTNWISAIKWCTNTSYNFISTSYDGTIKIWDIRSNIPLNTISTSTTKLLTINYNEILKQIVAGGADTKLHLYHMK